MNSYNISIFPQVPAVILDKKAAANKANYSEIGEGTLEELHNMVSYVTWSPAVFKDKNVRNQSNFDHMDVLCIDVDGSMPLTAMIVRLMALGWSYSITPSLNNMKTKGIEGPKERYHVIIPLSERIYEKDQHTSNYDYLQSLFNEGEIDGTLRDCAKFLYPSAGTWSPEQAELPLLVLDGTCFPVQKNKKPPISPPNTAPTTTTAAPNAIGLETEFIYNYTIGQIVDMQSHEWIEAIVANPQHAANNWTLPLNRLVFCLAAIKCVQTFSDVLTLVEKFAPNPLDKHDLNILNVAFQDGQREQWFNKVKGFKKDKKQIILLESIGAKIRPLLIREKDIVKGILFHLTDNVAKPIYDLEEFIMPFYEQPAKKMGIYDLASLAFIMKFLPGKLSNVREEVIANISLKEDPRISTYKLPFSIDPNMPTPHFDNALSNTKNAHLFKAFIGSLFIPESDKKQAVLLYGPSGVGKSAMTEFLFSLLGPAATVTSVSNTQSKHGTSALIGKRLAIFNDASTTRFYNSSEFKLLTGDKHITIEPKFKDPITISCNCKFIIATNFKANIDDLNEASKNRVITVIMDKPTNFKLIPNFNNKLLAEAPGIVAKCLQAYKELSPDHSPFVDELSKTELKEMASDNNEDLLSYFYEIFDTNSSENIAYGEARSAIDKFIYDRRLPNNLSDLLKKYLKSNIESFKLDGKHKYYKGIKLIKSDTLLHEKILRN